MFDLVLACFIGIGIGTCTGMVPGIHVNTAGAIMFASSAFLLNYISAEFLCVIFVAMSIAHALIEFVPSMLLGVPEEGTATSILPGHRMVWSHSCSDYHDAHIRSGTPLSAGNIQAVYLDYLDCSIGIYDS